VTELHDRVAINGTRDAVLRIIGDPVAIARVLPGAETVEATGRATFHCVLNARIQFLTIRAEVDATLHDADSPHHLCLELDGRPRGLAGSFHASIPFDLEPALDASGVASGTVVSYAVELSVTGRLATFGAPLMRDTMRRQIAQLVANIELELAGRGSVDGSP
jgi:2-furoyl-CoA dehydrogenase large subunit